MNHEPVKNDQRNAQKPKGSLAYPRPSPESVPGKCDKIHRRQMILLPGPESSQVTVAFWVTNPCRFTRKVKQTKMYVCTLEDFILVDIWIHCCASWNLNCTVLYTELE